MKKILANIAARYQGKKFFTTLAAYGIGGYLISQGHVEAGTALIGVAQGSYNVGQGMADAKKPEGVLLEASIERIGESIARRN